MYVEPSSQKRLLVLTFTLILMLAFAVWWFARPAIRITINNTVSPKSNFYFIPEHWKESKLSQLRNSENFKDIPFRGQLDLFLKLCDWTHRQWMLSVPDPYPLNNAIDILADIRSGKTGGFCGQYAYVLADVLKAMGFFAVRYIELWSAQGESHFVVEAWSDQFAKWMILDPAENLYYEFQNSSEPANALEIRQALSQPGKIHARSAGLPHADLGDKKMHLYANFAASTRSDLMRLAKPLTVQDRFDIFVFFKDSTTDPAAFDGHIPYTHITSRPADIYFDCNHVRVEYRICKKQGRITFLLFTDASMFNFDSFAISRDNGKTWERSDDNFYIPIPKETESLWIAAVNMSGRFGRPTKVEISAN